MDPSTPVDPELLRHLLSPSSVEVARAAGISDDELAGLAQAYARGVGRIVAAELAVTGRALARVPPDERAAWLQDWLARVLPFTGPAFQQLHDDLLARGAEHLIEHPDAASVRQLTVAFVDLRGSTRYMLERGREDIRALVDALFHVAREVSADHDVTVVKHLGDGFLLDGHERSEVLAAARDAVVLLGERTPLAAGAGVDHGEVTSRAGDHFGPPVNFASRLAEVAPAGGLAIGAQAVPDPPPPGGAWRTLAIRGLPEPPRVYVVEDLAGAASRP